MKRIAIMRLSAMGDCVMMVPTVRALQRAYPDADITWIISRPMHALLEGLSGVRFIVIDKPRSLKDYWTLRKLFSADQFDVLLATQANMRVNCIYPFIKAKRKIGFDNTRSRDGHRFFVNEQILFKDNHLLESFLQFAKHIGADVSGVPMWDLAIDDAAHQFAHEHLGEGKWLAVNPSASKPHRNWSLDKMVELIDRAVERFGVKVVLTGGPGAQEVAMSDEVARRAQSDCLVLTGKTTLKQLAAVLAQVDVLVAPDTGPVHLATAMGTPVVGLYADVSPRLSGPYLSQSLVVDQYPVALKTFRGCDVGGWNHRVHDARAMGLITVDAVLEKLGAAYVTLPVGRVSDGGF